MINSNLIISYSIQTIDRHRQKHTHTHKLTLLVFCVGSLSLRFGFFSICTDFRCHLVAKRNQTNDFISIFVWSISHITQSSTLFCASLVVFFFNWMNVDCVTWRKFSIFISFAVCRSQTIHGQRRDNIISCLSCWSMTCGVCMCIVHVFSCSFSPDQDTYRHTQTLIVCESDRARRKLCKKKNANRKSFNSTFIWFVFVAIVFCRKSKFVK